jgi:hypothetical protein
MAPGAARDAVASSDAMKAAKHIPGSVHAQQAPVTALVKLAGSGLDRQGGQSLLEEAHWRVNLRGEAHESALVGRRPASWWTGVPPAEVAGVQADGTLTSLPLPVRRAASPERVKRACALYATHAWHAAQRAPRAPWRRAGAARRRSESPSALQRARAGA